MKTKLAALAVIASLALAGCSAGNQSAESTPSATVTPSASAVAPSNSANSKTDMSAKSAASDPSPVVTVTGGSGELKDWANTKYAQWDEFQAQSTPYKRGQAVIIPDDDKSGQGEWVRLVEWSAPAKGELVVSISGQEWSGSEMRSLATYIVEYMHDEYGDVDSATVTTEDKTTRVSASA